MIDIVFGVLCAFLNRARGTKLFELTASTGIGRWVSMGGIALLTYISALLHGYGLLTGALMFFWVYITLMLWCVWGWDYLWSATIGDQPDRSRLWGLAHLTLRMGYGIPCIVGLAFIAGHPFAAVWALGCLLMGIPYYLSGFLRHDYTIYNAEMAVGGMWWVMISGVLQS